MGKHLNTHSHIYFIISFAVEQIRIYRLSEITFLDLKGLVVLFPHRRFPRECDNIANRQPQRINYCVRLAALVENFTYILEIVGMYHCTAIEYISMSCTSPNFIAFSQNLK